MKQKELIVLAAGLLVGAGLAISIYFVLDLTTQDVSQINNPPGVSLLESAAVDSPAPDFELQDIANETHRLNEMRGKIVVINFWATWCEPCKIEMPFFQKLYSNSQEKLQILAVNFDEPPEQVKRFAEEYELSFPVLLDPGAAVQDLYRVRGYPTTFLLDEDGIIRFHHIGLITEEQIYHYISELGTK